MQKENLIGKRFGKLTVISAAENKGKNTAWACKCDCGKIKDILTYNLKSGKSKSCGCVRNDKLGNFARTHGYSKTRLYGIYKGIKSRCYNSNNPAYIYYGGKGVIMCQEWIDDFNCFREWALMNGYDENKSIDRININGNYEPNNCRWVDWIIQQNNKTTNVFVTINGEKSTISQIAQKKGLNKNTLHNKFYRLIRQLDIDGEVTEIIIKTKDMPCFKEQL